MGPLQEHGQPQGRRREPRRRLHKRSHPSRCESRRAHGKRAQSLEEHRLHDCRLRGRGCRRREERHLLCCCRHSCRLLRAHAHLLRRQHRQAGGLLLPEREGQRYCRHRHRQGICCRAEGHQPVICQLAHKRSCRRPRPGRKLPQFGRCPDAGNAARFCPGTDAEAPERYIRKPPLLCCHRRLCLPASGPARLRWLGHPLLGTRCFRHAPLWHRRRPKPLRCTRRSDVFHQRLVRKLRL